MDRDAVKRSQSIFRSDLSQSSGARPNRCGAEVWKGRVGEERRAGRVTNKTTSSGKV